MFFAELLHTFSRTLMRSTILTHSRGCVVFRSEAADKFDAGNIRIIVASLQIYMMCSLRTVDGRCQITGA